MEGSLPVVPPSELLVVGVQMTVRVDELSRFEQRLQPRTLGGSHMCLADECRWVVHVEVGAGDVEVSADMATPAQRPAEWWTAW